VLGLLLLDRPQGKSVIRCHLRPPNEGGPRQPKPRATRHHHLRTRRRREIPRGGVLDPRRAPESATLPLRAPRNRQPSTVTRTRCGICPRPRREILAARSTVRWACMCTHLAPTIFRVFVRINRHVRMTQATLMPQPMPV
jgi:hypothetical protein